MQKYIRLAVLVIASLTSNFLSAQNEQIATNMGKEFWFAFGSWSDFSLQIRLVAWEDATVKMTFTNDKSQKTFNLVAGEVYTYAFSSQEKRMVANSHGTETSHNSVHLQSDIPIAVYIMAFKQYSTEGTHVLPVNSLGTEHYQISYEGITYYGDSYIAIATEDDTKIYEDDKLKTTLNKGQVLMRASTFHVDLTSKKVSGDKPFAHFITPHMVYVPKDTTAGDCLFEQMAPASSWGKTFFVPVTSFGINRVRIMASQDNTQVNFNGGTVKSGNNPLKAGEFMELEILEKDKGCYINTSKPVGVVSYLVGGGYGWEEGQPYKLGDPGAAWIPPLEQKVKSTFTAPFIALNSQSVLEEHYALVVTPTPTKNQTSMTIGKNAPKYLTDGWVDNAASGHSFLSIKYDKDLFDESYLFENPAGFTILSYGIGNAESYYCLSSAAFRNLETALTINDIDATTMNNNTYCFDELEFEINVDYNLHPDKGHIKWYIDNNEIVAAQDKTTWSRPRSGSPDLNGKHTYKVEIKATDGQVQTVTTGFTISDPEIPDAEANPACLNSAASFTIKNSVSGLTYNLYSNPEATTLIGTSTGNGRDITLSSSSRITEKTNYYIVATSAGCKSPVKTVEVTPSNSAAIIKANPNRIIKDNPAITFTAEGITTEQCEWNFGDGNQSFLNPANHTYAVNDEKEFTVRLIVQNQYGCKDTAFQVLPVVNLSDGETIPNTFTPNGDGYNDVFMANCNTCELIQIFDRQGKKLYEGTGGWDGFYKGKFAGNDTYFYVITITQNGQKNTHKGYVTIMGRNQ